MSDAPRLDPSGVGDPGSAAALLRREASFHVLPRRIAAAAARLAGAEAAIYVVDVDGSALHLLDGTPGAFPDAIEAPLGIGPEIPLESLAALEAAVAGAVPGASCEPLLLGDRALGAIVSRGTPAVPLGEFAAEAALALEHGSGYTDAVHATRRRRRPEAAAEIQQNLLPPRLARISGAVLAGGVLPGYEVGGDFFDYADDEAGGWLTLADAVGKGNEAAALASLAVGALRSSRRSGARLEEASRAMHEAVRGGSPGTPFVTAVSAVWDTRTGVLRWITAGHPADGDVGRRGRQEPHRRGHPPARHTRPRRRAGGRPVRAGAGLTAGPLLGRHRRAGRRRERRALRHRRPAGRAAGGARPVSGRHRSPGAGRGPRDLGGGAARGRADQGRRHQLLPRAARAFPDLAMTVRDVVDGGDTLVARVRYTGTNTGDLMGMPATGKAVNVELIDITRFGDDGPAHEHWGVMDQMTMMQQLGVVQG